MQNTLNHHYMINKILCRTA